MSAVHGPHRLILIRSGVYQYAEVEIDRPLHLVAANNVGKTTLIAALQFLYVDDARQMHFSHDWSATKQHYFPESNSFVLFECLTEMGWRVVGAGGLGPAEGYDYERFVYQGRFEREDFFDGQRFRSRQEVLDRVVARDYRKLEPKQLRQALIGSLREAPLGVVPLRRSSNYSSFRVLFRNLLRLSHLPARRLKELLIDIHAHRLTHRRIDLKDSHERYRRTMRKAEEVRELKSVEREIRNAVSLHENRQRLRGELTYLRDELEQRVAAESKRLKEEIQQRKEQLEKLAEESEVTKKELKNNRGRRDEIVKSLGGVQNQLDNLDKARRRFDDFNAKQAKESKQVLEEKRDDLVGRLRSLSDADPKRVKRRIQRLKTRLDEDRRLLEERSKLAITRLRRETALPDSDIEDAFRVLNPALLGLAVGDDGGEGLQILNRRAAVERLRRLAARVGGDGYGDQIVRITAEALPDGPALSEKFDPEEIKARIEANEKELEQKKKVRDDLKRRQKLEQDKTKIESKLEKKQKRLNDWENWQRKEKKRPELEKRHREFEKEKGRVSEQIEKLESAVGELSKRRREVDAEKKERQKRIKQLRHSLKELPRVSFEVEPASPSPTGLFDVPLDELFEDYDSKYQRQKRQSDQLKTLLTGIEKETCSRFVGAEQEQTIRRLREALEGLEQKEQALDDLWLSLITGLRRQLKGLVASLQELKSQVSALNRALARRQVSNLAGIELLICQNDVLIRRIEQIRNQAEFSMFADQQGADEAVDALRRLLEDHPKLEVEQLFELQLRIEDASGKKKRFDALDQIESQGTTMTVKVLVHLELLHRMLRRRDEAHIPFFLDEVSVLDERNLSEIIDHASAMNFVPVVASPNPSDCVDTLYFLNSSDDGDVLLDERSRIRLERPGGGEPESPAASDQSVQQEALIDE